MAFEMQDYHKHIIFGLLWIAAILWFTEYLQIIPITNWTELLLYLPIVLFYCGLPDIDHQSSKPRFVLTILLLILELYYAVKGNITIVIILIVVMLIVWLMRYLPNCGHRGFTHGFVFVTLASLPLLWISWQLMVLGWLAATSHLVFDMEFKLW